MRVRRQELKLLNPEALNAQGCSHEPLDPPPPPK